MFQINRLLFFHLTLALVVLVVGYGECFRIGDNPYRRGESLDGRDRYNLEWMVDQRTNRITFNVTVWTRGWILFGLANNADERTGRDVVIGGVGKNGQAYFSDRHTGRYNERLKVDNSQDYTLLDSWETGTHTFLSFSRELDTCDSQDYRITENRLTIIWAYGDQDNVDGDGSGGGGGGRRDGGSYNVYLQDPEYSPRVIRRNLYDQVPRVTGREAPTTQVWTVTRSHPIPGNDTSYLCSIHKAPTLQRKHHLIGFDIKFADEVSRVHTHHMVVHRCSPPTGLNARTLFEPFAQDGQPRDCLSLARATEGDVMPVQYCQQFYLVYALGGRAYFTPDNVGFPFGEDPDEYYLVQVHYDNPQLRSDLTINFNLDFFYTRRLRQNDGGLFLVGHDIPGLPLSSLIPPQTTKNRRFGHCSGECTRKMFPREGITIVGAMLHSHISGRQMRLHHFRRNEELPWVLYDDNYSNGFQQIRSLPRGEVQILPGDQLTMDCTYDNTWTNGTVVGGFRTRQEMCVSFLIYYTALTDFSSCRSEVVAPEHRAHFLAGATNFTYVGSDNILQWVAIPPSPRHLVGRTLTDISDNFVDWNQETRRELAELQAHYTNVHVQSPLICQRSEGSGTITRAV